MKYCDICEKVKTGEITLDNCGHRIYQKLDDFIENYQNLLAKSQGSYDGKWNYYEKESPDEIDRRMREHFSYFLNEDISEGQPIYGQESERQKCEGCGRKYLWVLNGNKLQLKSYFDHKTHDFVIAPEGERCTLEFPRPTQGRIKINNTLIFANFFNLSDAPENLEFLDEWNINYEIGVENVTQYKSEQQNIAYGQMSNMSIGIYANQNKTKIIIGPGCHPAEYEEYDTDKEYEAAIAKPIFKEFEFVGSISLGVWRWEATDLNTIDKDAINKLKNETRQDTVAVNVKKGIWEFQNFFYMRGFCDEASHNENKYIYSILELKE